MNSARLICLQPDSWHHTTLLDMPNIAVERCNVLNPTALLPLPADEDSAITGDHDPHPDLSDSFLTVILFSTHTVLLYGMIAALIESATFVLRFFSLVCIPYISQQSSLACGLDRSLQIGLRKVCNCRVILWISLSACLNSTRQDGHRGSSQAILFQPPRRSPPQRTEEHLKTRNASKSL